jgi:hypothetical protein
MPFILGLHASLAEEFAMTWPFNGDNVFFFCRLRVHCARDF